MDGWLLVSFQTIERGGDIQNAIEYHLGEDSASCILDPMDHDGKPGETVATAKADFALMRPEQKNVRRKNIDRDPYYVPPEQQELLLMFYCDRITVTYVYDWVNPDAKPAEAAAKPKDAQWRLTDNELAAAKKDSLLEHMGNIAITSKMLAGFERDLANSADEARRQQIQFHILHTQQDIHDEQDMLESIRTGQTVHTRGPWEEHAAAVAVRVSQQMADECHRAHQMQASAVRLLRVLSDHNPQKGREAEKLLFQKAGPGIYQPGGLARAQGVVNQIYGMTLGELKLEQDKRWDDQAMAHARVARIQCTLEIAEAVKRYSDRAVFVLSFVTPAGPGMAVSLAYEAGCTGIEDGPGAILPRDVSTPSRRCSHCAN